MDLIGLIPLIIGKLPINLYMYNLIYILVRKNMKKEIRSIKRKFEYNHKKSEEQK